MNGHRTYLDPPRTASVRCVQWIPPKREGHRTFMLPKVPKESTHD